MTGLEAARGRIRVMHLGGPKGLYGAERWILALVRSLEAEKIESVVCTIRDDPSLAAELCTQASAIGCRTHIFESPGRFNLTAISLIRDYIREHRIDVVHTHGYKTDILGLLAVRGTACKIVTTPHGWTVNADLKLRAYEFVDRLVFPLFDAVVPLSKGLFEGVVTLPGMRRKTYLIENGVDIDEIENTTTVDRDLLRWRGRGLAVIGYVGRLTEGKGLVTLLRAIAALGRDDVRLAIVGEGEQAGELGNVAESLGIRDRVRFFGYRPDRLAFLKGFDVFVLPSRSEGTPRCLMEAMAADVPVIATDIPGCRNLVADGKTGVLFQVDDHPALASSINALLNDRPRARAMVTHARSFVHQNYSAVAMASRYMNLYGALVAA